MRGRAFLAIVLGTFAVLASQTLSYGLVYPAGGLGSKWPTLLAVLAGALAAAGAIWLALRAHQQAKVESERFVALLGLVLSAFFLFVVVVGYGIPNVFLRLTD